MLATHYQQSNLDTYNEENGTDYKSSVNRVMPQFKMDGKLVFERDMNWAEGYTQTLEPRAQYLYVPYRDQSHINNYDSTLLQSDYSGLFRDRTYGGLDRIASANPRSLPASHPAFMMMRQLNVLTFLLVKSTISPSPVPVMTTLTGRKTTKRVRWCGRETRTGASPIAGVCAAGCNMTLA